MTGDWREEAQALWDRATRQKASESKVRLLEEAVRMADAHGDVDMGYQLRADLIDAATFGGYPDKALVAFAWCRGQQKKDPERFDPEGLLWKQKWVVGRIKEFPHITRKQISDALDDIEERFARVNAGRRSVMKLRYQTARDMGDSREEVERLWHAWLAAPRDHLTDCRACELDDELDHHIEKGEWEVALSKARPIIEGREKCAEIPHLTLGTLLYPAFKLGELERAAEFHRRGYAMASKNRDFLATVGNHIEFLALTGNHARGLTLMEKHLEWTLDHGSFNDRFIFFVAATFLLERVMATGERAVLNLRLSKSFPEHRADGGYETKALHAWMLAQATAIATKFDTRNGTTRYSQWIGRNQRLASEVVEFPLD